MTKPAVRRISMSRQAGANRRKRCFSKSAKPAHREALKIGNGGLLHHASNPFLACCPACQRNMPQNLIQSGVLRCAGEEGKATIRRDSCEDVGIGLTGCAKNASPALKNWIVVWE